MPSEEWIAQELAGLRARNLSRHTTACPHAGGKFVDGARTVLNFSSNDYLDLARDERVVGALRQALHDLVWVPDPHD